LLFSCDSAKKDVYSDQEYSLRGEAQKRFMAIKVVELIDDYAVDAFGSPIQEGQWYGVVNATKNFFLISWTDGHRSFNFDTRYETFYPDLKIKKDKAIIFAANTASCLGSAVDVDVLLLGPKELIFMNSMDPSGRIEVRIE
jgi:hypothetical protein